MYVNLNTKLLFYIPFIIVYIFLHQVRIFFTFFFVKFAGQICRHTKHLFVTGICYRRSLFKKPKQMKITSWQIWTIGELHKCSVMLLQNCLLISRSEWPGRWREEVRCCGSESYAFYTDRSLNFIQEFRMVSNIHCAL